MWNENSVQNDSSEQIECVRVTLRRAVIIKPRRIAVKRRDIIEKQSFPGIAPGMSFSGNLAKRMDFKLPLGLKPDTNSRAVGCRYEMGHPLLPLPQ